MQAIGLNAASMSVVIRHNVEAVQLCSAERWAERQPRTRRDGVGE